MIHSQRAKEGVLLIDHAMSPGTVQIPEGRKWESATVTCSHCGVIVVLNPDRTRPRHYCSKCDHYICDGCAALGECYPLAELIDATGDGKLQEILLKRQKG